MRRLAISAPELAILAGNTVNSGGRITFVARGWSMHPAIRDGDRLTVAGVDGGKVRPGEIVLYRGAGDRIVVHRVLRRRRRGPESWIEVAGDALTGSPESIRSRDIVGTVTTVYRGGHELALDRLPSRLFAGACAARILLERRLHLPVYQFMRSVGRTLYRRRRRPAT